MDFLEWCGSQEWSQYLRASVPLKDTQELACHIHLLTPWRRRDVWVTYSKPRKRTSGRHLIDFHSLKMWGNLFWHLSHQLQVEDCGHEWVKHLFYKGIHASDISGTKFTYLWPGSKFIYSCNKHKLSSGLSTDLGTTDTSFCRSPPSVQIGDSVRNGYSYHPVRSQWWRT